MIGTVIFEPDDDVVFGEPYPEMSADAAVAERLVAVLAARRGAGSFSAVAALERRRDRRAVLQQILQERIISIQHDVAQAGQD